MMPIAAIALFASARAIVGAVTPDYFWKYRTEKRRASRYFGEWRKSNEQIARLSRELAEARKAFDELSQQISDGSDLATTPIRGSGSAGVIGSERRAGVPDVAEVQANRSDVQLGNPEIAETIPEADGHALARREIRSRVVVVLEWTKPTLLVDPETAMILDAALGKAVG